MEEEFNCIYKDYYKGGKLVYHKDKFAHPDRYLTIFCNPALADDHIIEHYKLKNDKVIDYIYSLEDKKDCTLHGFSFDARRNKFFEMNNINCHPRLYRLSVSKIVFKSFVEKLKEQEDGE